MIKIKTGLTKAQLMALISLGIAGSVIYELPYIRYMYYDPLLEAFDMNNSQIGWLATVYGIGCLILYIPGGIAADKYRPKKLLLVSLLSTSVLGVILAFSMNYITALIVFFLFALSTSFVFWTSVNKAVRVIGGENNSGTSYGWYYAVGTFIALGNSIIFFKVYTVHSEDPGKAIFWTIMTMSLVVFIAFILVALTYREDTSLSEASEEDSFKISDLTKAIKNPYLWWASIIMFVMYTVYANVSYFTPYMTSQLGVEIEDSMVLTIIRGYVSVILAPLGGYFADKILKSTLKYYGYGFIITSVLFFAAMMIPSGQQGLTIAIIISLLATVFSVMMYGVMWSILNEINIPMSYAATAVGVASMVVYMPDLFVPAMFGNWLDTYGEQGGYFRMFMFMGICCGAAVILCFTLSKKCKAIKASSKVPAETLAENSEECL